VSLLKYKRIKYIRKASTNTKEFLDCHTQHNCNTGGRKTGMQLCFLVICPLLKSVSMIAKKQAAIEETMQCLGLWMLTGSMKKLI